MKGTWWVGEGDLDKDQREIISVSQDDSILVIGPPGSGKTNLLLLRANYLYLAGKRNIVIVTFTRSLREFIASGAEQYTFPDSKIMTCRTWQNDFLRQYGSPIKSTGDFEKDRGTYLSAIKEIIRKHKITNIYDAILLDEAQDYIPDEINIFAELTKRLFCVADERQKIYEGEDSIETIQSCVDTTKNLRYHYRNGINICRVADEIGKKWDDYQALTETSNYNEKTNPSTVNCEKCDTIEKQIDLIIKRIDTQRVAFPDELIGILCPTKSTRDMIWNAILASKHADTAFLLQGNINDTFPTDKQVVISTFHSAKGLEFRALHLAGCDELKTSFFNNNRRITFTAVTRAKTALSIYHCGDLYGYFEAAICSLNPDPNPPSMDDVFGGSK